jgi:Ca2+-binding RTX toxin-like protein
MKKNRGMSLYLWVEEKMSMVMNRNRNVEQNIGLRPLLSFKDIASGKEIFINGLVEEAQDIIFGSNTQADVITGHNNNDHLYGLDGNDTLNGGLGYGWLEGGVASDADWMAAA